MTTGPFLLLAACSVALIRPSWAGPALTIDRFQVNVRSDATTQSRRVAVLRLGEEVEQIGTNGEWIRIRMADGKEGWVHSDLVQVPLIVQGRGVRIREAGATSSAVLATVSKGTVLLRIGQQEGWYQVALADGRRGWVWSNLVRPKEISFLPTSPVASSLQGADGKTAAELSGLYVDGLRLEKAGDYNSALDLFEEVLRENPDHQGARFHSAQAHKQLREYDEALKDLYAARRNSPGRRDIMLELGEIYRLRGQVDSTRKYQALFRGRQGMPDPGMEPVNLEMETGEEWPIPDEAWIYMAVAASLIAMGLVAWRVGFTRAVFAETREPKPAAAAGGTGEGPARPEGGRPAHTGSAGPVEAAGLDRRIEEKWKELRQNSEVVDRTRNAVGKGLEWNPVERLRDHLDALGKALQMEEERSRIYAEIARLQEMKIEVMTNELRRGNTGEQ